MSVVDSQKQVKIAQSANCTYRIAAFDACTSEENFAIVAHNGRVPDARNARFAQNLGKQRFGQSARQIVDVELNFEGSFRAVVVHLFSLVRHS